MAEAPPAPAGGSRTGGGPTGAAGRAAGRTVAARAGAPCATGPDGGCGPMDTPPATPAHDLSVCARAPDEEDDTDADTGDGDADGDGDGDGGPKGDAAAPHLAWDTGRLDWRSILALHSEEGDRVGVYVCGPPDLQVGVQRQARRFGYHLHCETFKL